MQTFFKVNSQDKAEHDSRLKVGAKTLSCVGFHLSFSAICVASSQIGFVSCKIDCTAPWNRKGKDAGTALDLCQEIQRRRGGAEGEAANEKNEIWSKIEALLVGDEIQGNMNAMTEQMQGIGTTGDLAVQQAIPQEIDAVVSTRITKPGKSDLHNEKGAEKEVQQG